MHSVQRGLTPGPPPPPSLKKYPSFGDPPHLQKGAIPLYFTNR